MEQKKTTGKFKYSFSNRFEFVLTLLGFSFGLGDIWRLPYLVYRNGGGAFLVPYLFCMIIIGAPLYFTEIAIGQFSGKGAWRVWDICPLMRGFGIAYLIINIVPAVYLSIIRAWVVQYLVSSFSSELPWTTCGHSWNSQNCIGLTEELSSPNKSYHDNLTAVQNFADMNITKPVSSVEEFWLRKILHNSSGINDIGDINGLYVLYLFIAQIIIYLALVKSVKSIGKFVYVTVLGPIIIILIIFIRALTLPGSGSGILYFIKPDFEILSQTKVWVEAAFMAFYTLGPGYGGLIVFGAYNNFHDNCLRDAMIAVVSTLCFGLLNGFTVFSVIGVMAEETGVRVPDVLTSGGFSLGFVAYPKAVTFFPFPQLWAVLFFVVLLLPSMDYETMCIEPSLCIIQEMFPRLIKKRRTHLLTVMMIVLFLAKIPFASQAGVYMFQLFDWYASPWFLTLASLVEAIILAWVYGGDRLSRDISFMLGFAMPHLLRVSLAFVTPPFLLVLIIFSIKSYHPPTFGSYHYPEGAIVFGWILSVSAFFPVVIWIIYYAIRKYSSESGSVSQPIKKGLKPSNWEPRDTEYRNIFRNQELYRKRSFKDLLVFNLTGRRGFRFVSMQNKKEEIFLNDEESVYDN